MVATLASRWPVITTLAPFMPSPIAIALPRTPVDPVITATYRNVSLG